jgi:hypothetical protein
MEMRKGFDALVVLVAWMILKEINDRVFNSSMRHTTQLSAWIHEEGRQWVLAGYSSRMELVYYLKSLNKHFAKSLWLVSFFSYLCTIVVVVNFYSPLNETRA